jgi:hypothetical protein
MGNCDIHIRRWAQPRYEVDKGCMPIGTGEQCVRIVEANRYTGATIAKLFLKGGLADDGSVSEPLSELEDSGIVSCASEWTASNDNISTPHKDREESDAELPRRGKA